MKNTGSTDRGVRTGKFGNNQDLEDVNMAAGGRILNSHLPPDMRGEDMASLVNFVTRGPSLVKQQHDGASQNFRGVTNQNHQNASYLPKHLVKEQHDGASQNFRGMSNQNQQIATYLTSKKIHHDAGMYIPDVIKEQHELESRLQGQRQNSSAMLNRGGMHQVSGSIIGNSSTELHPHGGSPERATSHNVEESTAALGRLPKKIEGLTDFLRKEYYRRMGIYLNGGRKEHGCLLNFWKDHVSEAYKKLNEQKKLQQREDKMAQTMQSMLTMQKQDPAQFRRLMAEKEARNQARNEQIEREQKIAASISDRCKYHPKPVANCKTCQRGSQRSSARPGTAQPVRRSNSSAVPEVKNSAYEQYNEFSKAFEADVIYTINQDLQDDANKEKQDELQQLQTMQQAYEKQNALAEDEKIDTMLQLYFLRSEKEKADKKAEEEKKKEEEEEAKISPSKKPALPPRPSQPVQKPRVSIKQMMKPTKKPKQLKDFLDEYDQEVVKKYKFFSQLFKSVKSSNKRGFTNDPGTVLEVYLKEQPELSKIIGSDRESQQAIKDFFQRDQFLIRLEHHQDYICKSKTKQNMQIKMYYAEIPQKERQLYLIDFVALDKERGPQNGLEAIQEKMDEQRREDLEKELKAYEEELAKQKKAKLNKQRTNELAKPKDKWKVGKQLLEMQKKFPHDRVIQRMVKNEFATNQVFRYPDEYDKFNIEDEKKMKQIESDNKGLQKKDFSYGQRKLETFKTRDQFNQQKQGDDESESENIPKPKMIAFEKDLILEAQNYTKEASKRLTQEQGSRQTVRKSLAEIYQKMCLKHSAVIKKHYRMVSYGMDKESETFKKSYPPKFKTYFMRLIKTLGGKAPGTMGNKQVYKNSRRLPTTFMVAGTVNNHNKKIVMTASLAKKQVKNTIETRSRIFYRDDQKKKMPGIFMTNDDAENCRFEPIAGSLNPHFWKVGPMPPELKETADTEEAFREKHGHNLKKSHPEVFKRGILKKAQGFYRNGEFKMAFNTLMQGFKLISLRMAFEPDFEKKQAKRKEKKEREEREAKAKAELRKKNDDFEMEFGMNIDQLKEDPDDVQAKEKMPNEQSDDPKLRPILKEAYDLLCDIEDKEIQAKKKIALLNQQRDRLKKKQDTISSMQSIEDQVQNTKALFKTIMCPLRESCSNHTGERWPKSSAVTTTQLGQACPYAHHSMELRFPQTIQTKIAAISKIKKTVKGEVDSKKPKKPFIPTGQIDDCKGGCFTGKCNMCKYKQMAGTLLTDLEQPMPTDKKKVDERKQKCYETMQRAESKTTINHLAEMATLKKELNLDDMYCKKFGLLKKASILSFYGRDKDAKIAIATAATIVADQRKVNEEKQEAIQQRWKFKLGLDDFELPERANIKRKHPKDITDEDLAEVELGPGVTLATVRLYINKVSPFLNDAYNKNVFLDRLIEEFYLACEGKKIKKHGDIEKMKKHIEGLEEIAELADQFGEEAVEENLMEDEAEGLQYKPPKKKMCPEVLAKRKCKAGAKDCKYAHNPIQLECVPIKRKIENLKGVVASQSRLLHANTTTTPFVPPNKFIAVDKTCYEPYIEPKPEIGPDDEEGEKGKSIFEREDLFKDPLEEKD